MLARHAHLLSTVAVWLSVGATASVIKPDTALAHCARARAALIMAVKLDLFLLNMELSKGP